MYQGPKAVRRAEVVGLLAGALIGIGAAVGCGDDIDDGAALKGPAAAEAATVAPAAPTQNESVIRDASKTSSLAGTTGDNTTDTRQGAVVYSKGERTQD